MKSSKQQIRSRWIFITGTAIASIPIIMVMLTNTNPCETLPDHTDPLLRTRRYSHSLQEVRETIRQVILTLRTYGSSWKYIQGNGLIPIAVDSNPVEVTLQAEVPVLVFTDDLTVTLHGNKKETTVNVRSASRIGKGDFGENRRHIIQLLRALDQKMKP